MLEQQKTQSLLSDASFIQYRKMQLFFPLFFFFYFSLFFAIKWKLLLIRNIFQRSRYLKKGRIFLTIYFVLVEKTLNLSANRGPGNILDRFNLGKKCVRTLFVANVTGIDRPGHQPIIYIGVLVRPLPKLIGAGVCPLLIRNHIFCRYFHFPPRN